MSAPRPENMRSPAKAWLRALEATAPIERGQAPILPLLIDTLAERFDAAPALLGHEGSLTYRALAQAVSRYARWGLAQGLTAGDVVCLLMGNCPDYMAIWLGLTRIGVTVSLLNTNLTGELLAHAIQVVAPRCVLVGAALSGALQGARARLPSTLACWAHGAGEAGLPRLDLEAARMPADRLSEAQAQEARHALRLCCGNGLRADVWEEFQRRFRIPQILEYYAATEGSFSLYNCEGRAGAIGRIPAFLAHRVPVALIKFDTEAGAPVRDEAGHCLRCAPDEVGEAIGALSSPEARDGGRFEGYADPEASRQKVLRDVFAEGDAWYRTGDLMRQDDQGFFYFVDRVGDTFRWKGENVSTGEDRKSTRLNSSHSQISYAVFCLK